MPNLTMDPSSGLLHFTPPNDSITYTYTPGDIAWMLSSTALVWLMTPGVGLLYSGLLRRKNALSMLFLCMGVGGVVTFQWWLWGFSLAFSDTASPFIGNFKYIGLHNVFENPAVTANTAPTIPSIVFCIFQLTFATITPMLAIGAIAERGRLFPSLLFVFLFSTFVYDPIACWTWNSRGWSYHAGSGVLDFAGGTVVHINSGCASLAISLFLPKRRGFGTEVVSYPPNCMVNVVLGTVFLWFGWFGFNGGSALGANVRAAQACFVTTLAASVGGLSWMGLDYIRSPRRRLSVIGFCSGAISALVAITPGSGYVGAPAAVLFGFLAGVVCNIVSVNIKSVANIDDTLDIFAMHGIGGLLGNILTGIFAQKSIALANGQIIEGGWIDKHFVQMGWQLANSVAGSVYSFVVTTAILWIMHYIPGLTLRCTSPEDEEVGIDELDMSEFAYDYVHLKKEIVIPVPELQLQQAPIITPQGQLQGRDRPLAQEYAGNGLPFHYQQQQYHSPQSQLGHGNGYGEGEIPLGSLNQRRQPVRDGRMDLG